MGRMKSAWISFIVFVVICLSSNIVTSDRPSHLENLLLKESVVRNSHGVMVAKLKLSPRKTLLSLKSDKSMGILTDGMDEEDERSKISRRYDYHNANKPAITFARELPPQQSRGPLLDNKDDAPLENQTETESNLSSGSSLQNRDESQQFGSLEGKDGGDFDNENESGLSQSALINSTTNDNRMPEIGQVWLSKNEGADGKSIEENDLQTLIAGFLKREIWTIPLFVFGSLNIVLITFFEIYVLYKTKGQSRGHLFLGQMLLLGLFFCSTMALLFAIYPSMVMT